MYFRHFGLISLNSKTERSDDLRIICSLDIFGYIREFSGTDSHIHYNIEVYKFQTNFEWSFCTFTRKWVQISVKYEKWSWQMAWGLIYTVIIGVFWGSYKPWSILDEVFYQYRRKWFKILGQSEVKLSGDHRIYTTEFKWVVFSHVTL